ncbi:MAG: T9SS type A sorting domain-containing protein [Candidatus Kapaibacterium sp.]
MKYLLISLVVFWINCSFSKADGIYFETLDFDNTQDVIITEHSSSISNLPVQIFWGQSQTNHSGTISINTSNEWLTNIRYPQGDLVAGSFSMLHYNLDSAKDIFIHYEVYNDSLIDEKRVVIFGHNNLKNISTIYLDSITSNQTSPFYATIISPPDPTDSVGYDIFGRKFFPLEKFQTDYTPTPTIISSLKKDTPIDDPIIYPTPAKDMLNIKNSKYDEIIIYTTKGIEILRQSIVPDSDNSIDIMKLTSAAYYLVLHDRNSDKYCIKKFIKIK